MLKLSEDMSHFLVIQDIQNFCEQDPYRYVKHAGLYDHSILFCAELGKDKNKIVAFSYD